MNRFPIAGRALAVAALLLVPVLGLGGGAAAYGGPPVEPALGPSTGRDAVSAPGAPVSVIVRLVGPALADMQAADGASLLSTDRPAPPETIAALQEALVARQRPAAQRIAATGATVMDSYQAVANGFLVRATPDQVSQIARMPGVLSVARAPMVALALADSVPHIGAQKTWEELKFRGAGSLVAVLDTGIDYTHATMGGSGEPEDYTGNNEDLVESGTFPTARVVGGYDFAGKRYSPSFLCGQLPDQDCHSEPRPDDDPLDSRGHGTFMAGVIAGKGSGQLAQGVAPGAGLVALKIFGNPRNSPVVSDLLGSALEWVARNNARLEVPGWPTERVDVVNLSLTGTWLNGTLEAERLVSAAAKTGLTVVVAAGNESDLAYSVDAVGSASSALSVAGSYASGEGGLLLDAEWSTGGQPSSLSSLAVDSWIEGQPRTTSLGGFSGPLAWMGLACNNETPVQDVAGKVALIERGVCPFTEKLTNAQAAGATAAVVFTMPERGTDHMYGSAELRIPAVMTPRWAGLELVDALVAGAAVQARVYVPEGDVMVDTLGYLSGRGPARLTGHLKPQITAPGEIIQSAWPGMGQGGRLDSGTSIAAAHVSGAAALLAERGRKQGLRLDALDVAALAMNYALPTVRIERQDVGRLAPVSRQGAGRIDVYRSAIGNTIARSEASIADLGFGMLHVANEPLSTSRRITIRNLSSAAKTYRLSPDLAFPDEDGGHGVAVAVDPRDLTVPAGQTGQATVAVALDPPRMRNWSLANREAVVESGRLGEMEVDGFVRVTETGGDGQPKTGGDQVVVPFLSLPQRHSCIRATTTEPFVLSGIDDRVTQRWANPCPEPGIVRTYSQIATDPVDPDLPAALDITSVGFRYGPYEPGNPESDTRLEWVVQTRGSRLTPRGTQFRVYLDVNQDGEYDFVVFNKYGPDLTLYMQDVSYPRGRWVTAHAPLYPGTLEPDYWQTEGLIFFQPYDLDETASRLYAIAEEMDIDVSSGDARFDFAVTASDDAGDYELVDGRPAGDSVPQDLATGGALSYEQGKQACLAPAVDVDVPGGGDASIDLSSLCNAPADGSAVPMRLLTNLPYNLPGPSQVDVRTGRLQRAGPTPGPERSIFLPYGARP